MLTNGAVLSEKNLGAWKFFVHFNYVFWWLMSRWINFPVTITQLTSKSIGHWRLECCDCGQQYLTVKKRLLFKLSWLMWGWVIFCLWNCNICVCWGRCFEFAVDLQVRTKIYYLIGQGTWYSRGRCGWQGHFSHLFSFQPFHLSHLPSSVHIYSLLPIYLLTFLLMVLLI